MDFQPLIQRIEAYDSIVILDIFIPMETVMVHKLA